MSSVALEGLLEALPSGGRRRLAGLELLAAGAILPAFAAAEELRRSAPGDEEVTRALLDVVDDGDLLAQMLGLRALSAVRGREIDDLYVAALEAPELGEQAAWALAGRPPVLEAIPALASIVAAGGFVAMPAQLALERWSAAAGDRVALAIRASLARCSTDGGWSRLVETLALVNAANACRPLPAARKPAAGGLRVAQILLRGRVDAGLETAGSGDGGGVVTLLVQLARELGRRPDVEQSLIIARAREVASPGDESLGPAAAIVRLPFGPREDVPVAAMWEHRAQIERALTATLAAAGPIDVAHLRYADAGTFAAARVLRRCGVRTVFTLAPDPHALIASGERTGRITRAAFAEADVDEHNLFRLRLVGELSDRADQIVTLPRAGGRVGLERLVGRPLAAHRTASIPEGIALEPLEQARRAVVRGSGASAVASDLGSAVAGLGGDRLGLPLILSAGRFHRVKGFPGLVEAWAGDPALVERFNLVLVGGDLERPSPDEQAVIDEIDAVKERHPAACSGLVLLGMRPHEDVAQLLAIARNGLAGTVGPAGLYACASAKEEFGVALLEALASGLPVVAPAGGGPDSYLEHGVTGILVEPGNVDRLRDGLHQAALLAGSEERAVRAARLVRERFGIGEVAAALTESYRRAVAPR